jgi:hypothetical protein
MSKEEREESLEFLMPWNPKMWVRCCITIQPDKTNKKRIESQEKYGYYRRKEGRKKYTIQNLVPVSVYRKDKSHRKKKTVRK